MDDSSILAIIIHGAAWWGWPGYPYYLDYPYRQVRDRFRVEFKGGQVTAITQELSN